MCPLTYFIYHYYSLQGYCLSLGNYLLSYTTVDNGIFCNSNKLTAINVICHTKMHT